MKYLLSVICIYVCLTIGSMENIKSDIKETATAKEIHSKKHTVAAKETLDKEKGLDTKHTADTKKKIETKEDLNSKEDLKPKDLKSKEDLKPKEDLKSKEDLKTKEKVETKEKIQTKEKVQTKENKDKKEVVNKLKQYRRKTYATKEDIPKDYLDYLKKRYNIVEDPVGEYERKMALYDFYNDYDYDMLYNEYSDESDTEKDSDKSNTDSEEKLTETEKVTEISGNINETEEGCKVCKIREADRKLRLASIQSTILDKLGFSMNHLPNMTGKTIPKLPSLQKLIEQHEMLADEPYKGQDEFLPEDEYYGQVKRAYTISQEPPDDFEIHVPGGCYFELPESVTSRKVRDASLWIYLEPSAFDMKKVVEIYIYVVPQKAKPQHILKGPMRYKKSSTSGWMEFKFAHIVHHWIKQPATNKGVIIQAIDEDGHNHVVTPSSFHFLDEGISCL